MIARDLRPNLPVVFGFLPRVKVQSRKTRGWLPDGAQHAAPLLGKWLAVRIAPRRYGRAEQAPPLQNRLGWHVFDRVEGAT